MASQDPNVGTLKGDFNFHEVEATGPFSGTLLNELIWKLIKGTNIGYIHFPHDPYKGNLPLILHIDNVEMVSPTRFFLSI
jgi:hypothetical protein